jgi:transcriptional regulator with XRE-family HTH domain
MPSYRDAVLMSAADVRRVRVAAGFTVAKFALELGVDRRTVQRWETAGAVLERVPSLLMRHYAQSTLGRLERVAELGELALEIERGARWQWNESRSAKLERRAALTVRKVRHFSAIAKKRPRKTRKATRTAGGALPRHG